MRCAIAPLACVVLAPMAVLAQQAAPVMQINDGQIQAQSSGAPGAPAVSAAATPAPIAPAPAPTFVTAPAAPAAPAASAAAPIALPVNGSAPIAAQPSAVIPGTSASNAPISSPVEAFRGAASRWQASSVVATVAVVAALGIAL